MNDDIQKQLVELQAELNDCTIELQEARICVKELECKHERLMMRGMKLQKEIPDEIKVPKASLTTPFPRRKKRR